MVVWLDGIRETETDRYNEKEQEKERERGLLVAGTTRNFNYYDQA